MRRSCASCTRSTSLLGSAVGATRRSLLRPSHAAIRPTRPCATSARARGATAREPWWIEYPTSFFPVLLVVFLLRSFSAEPFKIPSSSMRPTLEVGDFILVNKFTYGIRLPIIEHEDRRRSATRSAATSWCSAIRSNPSQDFIKRVVGVRRRHGRLPGQAASRSTASRWPQERDGTLQLPRGPALRDARRASTRRSTPATGARSTTIARQSARAAGQPAAACARSRTATIAITMTAAASPARCRPATTS